MQDDKHLISELHRGRRQALQQIYMKYKDTLLTIAASMLHDADAAEDVLHDVFVSFAGSVRRIELKSNLRNYLIASVMNRIRGQFRRKKHPTIGLEQAGQIGSNMPNPVQSAVSSENFDHLANALSHLPFEQRETIILHLHGGMKFRDIAKMQRTPISTIQGRYRYGLEKLRVILDRELKNERFC